MTEKTQFEVDLVLPGNSGRRDACVQRLTDLLEAKEGVEAAHLLDGQENEAGRICVHFDPRRIPLGEVRAVINQAGARLGQRFGHLLLKAAPMHARQARAVQSQVSRISGVLDAAVSPAGVVRVEFDRQVVDERQIQAELHKLGSLQIQEGKSRAPDEIPDLTRQQTETADKHDHDGVFGESIELIFAAFCGTLLLVGWLLSILLNVSPWVPWGFFVAAYFFGGYFTFRDALGSLRALRLEIDFLMLVAAVGAAALGEWAEGALLLFLFSLGHALEHYAMGRAKRAIESLSELAPQTALVRRNDNSEVVPVEQLKLGDLVIVKPNERIPADGFVIKGESSVNQAPITGESIPVDKRAVDDSRQATMNPDQLGPEHRVFAGTINGGGVLEIEVLKLSADSTLSRVVQMVAEAETQKSPTQRFTDKFERLFVPSVLAFVFLLLFAWAVIDEPFRISFYRAMAVLVAASPCALAIATPSAILSGVARAARGGVLVKGGGPLENLGQLDAIAFDKTGTLTEGKPRLTDVVATGPHSEKDLLRVATAVERLSDHPLAAAVVQGANERLKGETELQAHGVQSITGRGVKATVEGLPVYIGKDSLFAEVEGPPLPEELRRMTDELKASGRTTMIVRHGDSYLGVLGLMDTPREAAKVAVRQLKELGIRRMLMLSGDNQKVADAVAKDVGIDEAVGDLMPDGKVAAIQKLSRQSGVAMVGDGVNDAPAMASATVGIAMGAAGSDVALETADVALMSDDLSQLSFAVGLSRQTRRIIRQNLWVSLGMVAFLIPATVLGLQMGIAVLFHEGSTILVAFNALRLLRYRNG